MNAKSLRALLSAVAALPAILSPTLAMSASTNPTVTVVNTTANPVPVTGSITVGNSVVPVEVSNADPIPVAVVGEPTEIYAETEQNLISPTNGLALHFEIPDGKRLIIETVTVIAQVPIGTNATATMFANLGGDLKRFDLALQPHGVVPETSALNPKETYVGTHSIRVRVDGTAGTNDLIVEFRRSAVAGESNVNNFGRATISGYLVSQ